MNVSDTIKKFIRFHKYGLAAAFLVGAIITAPPMVFHFSKAYGGVEMLKTNTEAHYVTQVQEVYDGHPDLGNPFYADLKNTPYLFPPFSPNLIAVIGKLFNLNAIAAVMLVRFLATSTMCFLIYYWAFQITNRRLPGVVAGPAVMLGYSLLDPTAIKALFNPANWPGEKTFIDYGRPINPQISSLIFFAYLVAVTHAIKFRSRVASVVAAAFFGIGFYAYLFVWTFILALNGCLALVALIKKDRGTFWRIAAVTAGAFVLALPYFWHTHIVSQQPFYSEVVPRFGFIHTRVPNISRVIVGCALLFVLMYRRLSKTLQFWFAAIFVAAFAVVNEQVITNIFIFNHHFHWYYNTPLAIIFLVIVADRLSDRIKPVWRRCGAGLIVAVCLYNGIMTQIVSYRTALPQVVAEQRYAPLFAWLNTQTSRDSTVVANYDLSVLLPVTTHNNIYNISTSIYTLISTERLLNIYAAQTYLRGVPTSTARQYFKDHEADIAGIYGYTNYFQPGVCSTCVPSTTIEYLTKTYEKLNDQNFISFLKQYPADYIVWDTKNDPEWRIERFILPELKRFGDLVVYAVLEPARQ